jgi:hypothetical protein
MAVIRIKNPSWTEGSSGIEKWISVPVSVDLKEGMMTFMGFKDTVSALPNTGNEKGDFYIVTDTSTSYIWDGTKWTSLGSSEISSDKVTSLTGYVKAEESAEIKETDTLNVALGKLEKVIEDNELVTASALVNLNTRVENINLTLNGVDVSVNALEDASK